MTCDSNNNSRSALATAQLAGMACRWPPQYQMWEDAVRVLNVFWRHLHLLSPASGPVYRPVVQGETEPEVVLLC